MPLPESLSKFVGQTTSTVYHVEKGAIARFAEAVGDPNPLYWDEEYAGKSRQGSIVAPPGFFGWPEKREAELPNDLAVLVAGLAAAGYGRILDGGIEWEFFLPIKAGDKLTVKTSIRNIMERSGKTGKAVFLFRDITYTNQNDDLVATARQTTIHPANAPMDNADL
jgi:acyl dehydratase